MVVAETASFEDRPLLVELAERREEFLGFVARRAGSGVEPQEVVQRALLRASEHAEQLRDRSRAKAWFYAILRRTLADVRQEQRRAGGARSLQLQPANSRDVASAIRGSVATRGSGR